MPPTTCFPFPALRCALAMLAMLALTALQLGCASGLNRPMQLTHEVGPAYPEAARAGGIAGWVRVRYDVTAAGLGDNAQVIAAQPPGVFDAAALQALAQWRYRPALVDGAPAAVRGVVSTLRFTLDGAQRYEGY